MERKNNKGTYKPKCPCGSIKTRAWRKDRKGVSSVALSKKLGVTQKSA
jgi:hypothetical protein